MASTLLPTAFHVNRAEHYIAQFSDPTVTYYFYLGNPVPTQTNAIPDINDDELDSDVAVYRNMMFGKVIANTDVCLLINNYPYVSGTVYSMYDDGNPFIFDLNFYAIVNAGAFSHVWKVLDNNNGAESIVPPNIADIDATDEVYITSDGYQWKYMYSVTSDEVADFSNQNYFPLVANAAVAAVAVQGAIDVIAVDGSGEGYNNYLTGTFGIGDVRVGGSPLVYSISGNAIANATGGYYQGCLMYISSGTGVGSFSSVTGSFSNANGTFVTLAVPLAVPPQNASEYQLSPQVIIQSAGFNTANARAMALVNSVGNSIYSVEILQRGANYQFTTATVQVNAVVGVVAVANVRAIQGPPGGHGANAAYELAARNVGISVTITETEGNTIPATNDFQQIGIINTPLFNNVTFNMTFANGVPLPGEEGFVITNRLITHDSVTVQQGNTILTTAAANAHLELRIFANDTLYLESGDNTSHQIVTINAITNSTQIILNSPALWACTTTQVYVANLSSSFYLQSAAANVWIVGNVSPNIQAGDYIILANSGSYGQISTIATGGNIQSLNTFIGMFSYTGTQTSGTFTENEVVFQGPTISNATATASLFSAQANAGILNIYCTNQVGQFILGNTIQGVNSGAVANLTAAYSPAIIFGSGKPIYIENIDLVDLMANTNENFLVVVNF